MPKGFFTIVYNHIKSNGIIYFLVCMCFIIGVSSGAFTVKALGDGQKQELISYMRDFFRILNDEPVDAVSVLKQSLINNLQTVTLIWILGIIVIGIPFILIIVAIRGYIMGFTVGFLAEQLGFKGILFALISIFPQNLFIIPGIIGVAAVGISFSKMIIINKFKKPRNRSEDGFKQFALYSTINGFICLFIAVGCIIEAYVTPMLMKLISNYM